MDDIKYLLNFSDDTALNQQILRDLESIGVDEKLMNNVFFVTSPSELLTVLKGRLLIHQNFAVFGTYGVGKTQIVKQAAKSFGMETEILTTSTRPPEDFSGLPTIEEETLTDAELAQIIEEDMYYAELDRLVGEALQEKIAADPDINIDRMEYILTKSLRHKVKRPTDEEIKAAMPQYRKIRRVISSPAPQWVKNILKRYREKKQMTLLFLDEINHAKEDTLNSLFNLVLEKKFADSRDFDLGKAMIVGAAGNFGTDNFTLTSIPKPLFDRLQAIIYYMGNPEESLEYLKRKYSTNREEYPNLCKLLFNSAASNDVWLNSFSSPRSIEVFIEGLSRLEEYSREDKSKLQDITSVEAAGLTSRNVFLSKITLQFLHDIGCPVKAPGIAGASAGYNKIRVMAELNKSFIKFMRSSNANISFGGGTTGLPEFTFTDISDKATAIDNFVTFICNTFGSVLTKNDLDSILSPNTADGSLLQLAIKAGVSNSVLNKLRS